ncbi:MAG: hypothetical protein KAG64_02355 [Bacteroidales bacterium]|nr:hypothetical protein [Bacteroidales bacterium]
MENGYSKVLIAPLDWGLGHAARCIPLIHMFLEQGKSIAVASSGGALAMLKEEFPNLLFYDLPPYDVHYEYNSMAVNMILQLPKMRKAMLNENRALHEILKTFPADLIVSDNRYGVNHPSIPSVFIGHQLAIQLPVKAKMFSKLTFKWHESMLKPFNQIWIPDFDANPNLSGVLSHGVSLKTKSFFIGPLSRFKYVSNIDEDLPLLIMLSGQEPRRSQFEQVIIKQLENWKEEVVLLRGLPNEKEVLKSPYPNLQIFNHLPTSQLEKLLRRASRIICRSGYSSIMDLAALRKKVLFIPTTGQTEQEYLAVYHAKKGNALFTTENANNILDKLKQLDLMLPIKLENNRLEYLINHALKEL